MMVNEDLHRVFQRCMDQVRKFFLALLDELKDVPELPPPVREVLPLLHMKIVETFEDSKTGENAAKPFIKAVPTTFVPLIGPLLSQDEIRQGLFLSLYRVYPRVLREFMRREEFRLAMLEFIEKILKPALTALMKQHSEEIATQIAGLAKEGILRWSGEEPAEEFGPPHFLDIKSGLATLAAQQGVSPITDISSLLGDFWPEEESVDEFIATVRKWRHETRRSRS